ncbi:MAG: hypothetical protein HP024_04830 [Acholeplasmatales bacterium]|nr:hypothetical protein [Acholeplasmatales bacterium]
MIGIVKTSDKRFLYMSTYFKEGVIYSDRLEDFKDIDLLILPIGGVDRFLFVKDSAINLRDILANNNVKLIIAGKINDDLKIICQNDDIKLKSYLDEPFYAWENAKLTAYVLIKRILNDFDDSIMKLNILILGSGYCARAIYQMLKSFNQNIAIYCKDRHDIKELYCKGIEYENLNNLSKYDIIINTVDFNLIKGSMFSNLKYQAKLYDIASYPYGFCLDDAQSFHFKVEILPKLPSLIPKEAGEVLYFTIKKML